jgi:hypothetical protein
VRLEEVCRRYLDLLVCPRLVGGSSYYETGCVSGTRAMRALRATMRAPIRSTLRTEPSIQLVVLTYQLVLGPNPCT